MLVGNVCKKSVRLSRPGKGLHGGATLRLTLLLDHVLMLDFVLNQPAALQVLLDMRMSPQGVLALLTLGALARGVAWKAAAQATAGRLRSSAALASCAARLAPLLQVHRVIAAAARRWAWRRACCLSTRFSFARPA